jgi:hypothetical protein
METNLDAVILALRIDWKRELPGRFIAGPETIRMLEMAILMSKQHEAPIMITAPGMVGDSMRRFVRTSAGMNTLMIAPQSQGPSTRDQIKTLLDHLRDTTSEVTVVVVSHRILTPRIRLIIWRWKRRTGANNITIEHINVPPVSWVKALSYELGAWLRVLRGD